MKCSSTAAKEHTSSYLDKFFGLVVLEDVHQQTELCVVVDSVSKKIEMNFFAVGRLDTSS